MAKAKKSIPEIAEQLMNEYNDEADELGLPTIEGVEGLVHVLENFVDHDLIYLCASTSKRRMLLMGHVMQEVLRAKEEREKLEEQLTDDDEDMDIPEIKPRTDRKRGKPIH